MIPSNITKRDGTMNITTNRLMIAPRPIKKHKDPIRSISEYIPTPLVAAKKLSALTITDGIDVE